MNASGGDAGDGAVAEQLRVSAVVGAAGRDVDRDVADQPHAALGGVRAQRGPLALEAHLVGDRPRRAGERAQSSIQKRVALAEVLAPRRRDTGARGSASSPGQAANADAAL